MAANEGVLLERAIQGDQNSFETLYRDLQPLVRSFVYRLTADPDDVEDMVQEVFAKAYQNIASFEGRSTFKTWVFAIASNHARRTLKNRRKWHIDTHTMMRGLAHRVPELMGELEDTNRLSPQGVYEIKEHIDFCFTCVGKMLRLEEQLVVLLKEVYGFKISEIALILEFSESKVKHALRDGRKIMMTIFDSKCALVGKGGICNQCTELNGKFNPKQDSRKKTMEVKMAAAAVTEDRETLLNLRADICRSIDPLQSSGTDLHNVFLKLCRIANKKKQKK